GDGRGHVRDQPKEEPGKGAASLRPYIKMRGMNPRLRTLLTKLGPFLGLVIVIGLFAIPTETRGLFLSYNNFKIIFTQAVIVAIGALGMTLIIVSGGIDLSVGSAIALTSVIGALLIQK